MAEKKSLIGSMAAAKKAMLAKQTSQPKVVSGARAAAVSLSAVKNVSGTRNAVSGAKVKLSGAKVDLSGGSKVNLSGGAKVSLSGSSKMNLSGAKVNLSGAKSEF
jgi:hypothetical protein